MESECSDWAWKVIWLAVCLGVSWFRLSSQGDAWESTHQGDGYHIQTCPCSAVRIGHLSLIDQLLASKHDLITNMHETTLLPPPQMCIRLTLLHSDMSPKFKCDSACDNMLQTWNRGFKHLNLKMVACTGNYTARIPLTLCSGSQYRCSLDL